LRPYWIKIKSKSKIKNSLTRPPAVNGYPFRAIFFLAMTSTAFAQATQAPSHAARPNILWITSEDNAVQWLGCYGNRAAQIPRLDALAREGVLYTHAYSNAPVCSVARCTLPHGVYSVTLGTQHMRSRYPIPPRFRAYVSYLRSLGYYCTNNSNPFSMPSWVAWRAGKLSNRFNEIRQAPQPVERLFDTSVDPWEINNLVDIPDYADVMARLRARLRSTMAETVDTGLVPRPCLQPWPAKRQFTTLFTVRNLILTKRLTWPFSPANEGQRICPRSWRPWPTPTH